MNRLFKPLANTKNQVVMLIAGLFMFLAAVSMMGCDNNDSFEAKLEEARMALDDGNYDRAKAILETLPGTVQVLEYLSNAIAGEELNLDTLNIISTLEDLDDEGNVGSIDMIGRIIGDENNELECEEIVIKRDAATEAIQKFKDIAVLMGVTMDNLSDNQKTQLGLLSVTRVVLTLAHRICLRTAGPVIMTEAWIQENRGDFTPLIVINEGEEIPADVEADLALINEDMDYIENTIGVFADSNDMKDDFEEFRSEIDADDNGTVTYVELNNYIAGLGDDA